MLADYGFSYVWTYPASVDLNTKLMKGYLKNVPLMYLSKIGLTVYLLISA